MFCKKCGAEIVANAKFCENCGTVVENDTPSAVSAQSSTTSAVGEMIVEYETVQEKKWGTPESLLFGIVAFVVLGTVIAPFFSDLLFGFTFAYEEIMYVLRGILIAGILSGIAVFIHSKRPLTDHYKFKCPYCNEENTVSVDEKNTFECSKCKKTMTIVDGQIKTLN